MKWNVAVVVLGAVLIGVLLFNRGAFPFFHPSAPTIVLQVRQLKQLVTVRYSVQRIVSLTEEKVPLGSESLLLMVQGEALGGVDLAELNEGDVSFAANSNRTILISLPPPKVTDVFLDEKQTKVWDRHVTWWTPWVPYSPDLETKARLKAVEEVRTAALGMGLLQQAQRNAQTAIRDLLAAFQVQVQFAGQHT